MNDRPRVGIFLALLASLAHFLSFPFRDHPIVTDVRFYLYFAAQTARGAVPHHDFFDSKTPLAAMAGAFFLRLGEALGAAPLVSIRVGYLVLAALGAVLAFVIHRRLGAQGTVSGALGLAAQLAFPVLGLMPAIGNIPKLLMALGASAAALCLGQDLWIAAGALGTLAFMDWQVGGLVLGAGFAAALCERERRGRACAHLSIGAALGALPFAVYFAAHGALAEVWGQVVASLFSRAARAASPRQIVLLLTLGCRDHLWMVALGALGVPLYLRYFRRAWRTQRAMAVALGVYHAGVVAFSFWDFQAYGDLFILLHSAAFFAGVALAEIHAALVAATRERMVALPSLLAFALALLAVRPWQSRAALRLPPLDGHTVVTLAEQRALAARLRGALLAGQTAVIGPAEQLFLTDTRSPLPFITWSEPVWTYHRRSTAETPAEVLQRELRQANVREVIADETGNPFHDPPGAYVPLALETSGGYRLARYALAPSPTAASVDLAGGGRIIEFASRP